MAPPVLGSGSTAWAACTPLCHFWGALGTAMLKPSHLLILGWVEKRNSTSLSLIPLPAQSRSEQSRQALVPVGAVKL